MELVPSRNSNIRLEKVQLSSKTILGRPIKLLYPVECPQECSVDATQDAVNQHPSDNDRRTSAERLINLRALKARNSVQDKLVNKLSKR